MRVVFAFLALFFSELAISSWQKIASEGTQLRLEGNFEAAKKVESRLIRDADNPVGHVFAINTIITHMTWDSTQTDYSSAILEHADAVYAWCEPLIDDDQNLATAHYYCGQASFIMSLHHALAGNYIRAGQYGTRTIEHLETALVIDPELTDAKLHLGVAYYIADNLPPFVKLFSKLLWFIPTGNSEKSLPYLIEVMENGDEYPDVAKYIYSSLLLNDEHLRPEAIRKLTELTTTYPRNARFQLRLISIFLFEQQYQAALDQGNLYLSQAPIGPDLGLAQIWMVRAYMGLGLATRAIELFQAINPGVAEELPPWSLSWYRLCDAQLKDLQGQRDAAINAYEEVKTTGSAGFVNEAVIEAADNGLKTPYTLAR